MAGEERERSFEKALARNLRAGAGGGAGAPRRDACAEAETLAAYHERLLAPEEMTFWKEHIAGCARCQEILAHVEETDAIAVNAAEEEDYALAGRVQERAADEQGNFAAAARAPRGAAPMLQVAAVRRQRRWIWAAAVPVGAIAAGLLVWVSVSQKHDRGQLQVASNQKAREVLPPASRREAGPLAKEAVPQIPGPATPAGARQDKSESVTAELYSKAPALSSDDSAREVEKQLRQKMLDERKGAVAAKKVLPLPESAARAANSGVGHGVGGGQGVVAGQTGAAEESNELLQGDRTKDLAAQGRNASSLTTPAPGTAAPAAGPPPPRVPAMFQTVEVASGSEPTPTTPEPTTDALSMTKAGVGAPAPAKQPQGAQSQAQQPQETQQMEGMSRFKENTALRLANAKSPVVIAAPGGKVSWRVGVAGVVERSEDSGVTRNLQSSGVVADLLAGSAVSDRVCWVAGRLGTILRTTDGGTHWVKVQAPVQDDITSVFAVSAEQATISTGRASYETTDGGVTWKKLTLP